MRESEQTGDVHVSVGSEIVTVDEAENVHVKADSIGENLVIKDAEFVYTGQDTSEYESDEVNVKDSGIKYYGSDMEDVYIENTASSVVIENSHDVFVEPGSVSGEIVNIGSENVFCGNLDVPNRDVADASVFGWKDTKSIEKPDNQVVILGTNCNVSIADVRSELTVYVTGFDNDVRVDGRGSVKVNIVGSNNNLSFGGLTNVDLTDVGKDNVTKQDDFPVSELIENRREEAYTDASFGKNTVTYQQPLNNRAECPVCTSNSDAIVKTVTETCFFLFGHPIYKYKEIANYISCEKCTESDIAEVSLNEDEVDRVI